MNAGSYAGFRRFRPFLESIVSKRDLTIIGGDSGSSDSVGWSARLRFRDPRSQHRGTACSLPFLYLVVDVFSRKIVGWTVQPEESQELAVDMIDAAIRKHDVPETRSCCTPTTVAR